MKIGIVGYGVYVPKYRITVEEIAKVWGEEAHRIRDGLVIHEKAVPNKDEDTATFSVEAARNALRMAGIQGKEIGAVFVGSESHPYAVKPTASMVCSAIGAKESTASDMEFACKAGTVAIQCCMGLVKGGYIKYGFGIGADSAQGRPGDALEYTAGAGAAAFLIGGNKQEIIAEIEGTYSYTTDTPDFWRREHQEFPSHGGRFTGEPAYFKHVIAATKGLLAKMNRTVEDYDYFVFHQPNGKFPKLAAGMLKVDEAKIRDGLVTPCIGNTYSAASLIGLAAVLDKAKPGEKILVTSFGSGAGSDSFSIVVKEPILEKRKNAIPLKKYIENKEYLGYGQYTVHKNLLKGL
ncbi:hydroxymethylglutaryl-CoA synthase [Candidatus Micrarchaeota archaeon CG08_land_8_20_14_0_20_49_17]|nr:MAG: hydroxymethylglutaryl-CoA synthase [Candidatus Micrarchaeota archaeon CG1_02_49_24]PIU10115.1 MAG: hydroxymethylglutaryl-CoA synthase [Candidatus Micrarchaeota archaeon CG08_land_8_20_14_0_20_49_17]HII53744.1 hydroxymethylglutaryl-CoA synthase [Candidatus Micrarchaeota archaeon]